MICDIVSRRKQKLVQLGQRLEAIDDSSLKGSEDLRLVKRLTKEDCRNLNAGIALCRFFDAFNSGPHEYKGALEIARDTGLVPMDLSGMGSGSGGVFGAVDSDDYQRECLRNVETIATPLRRHVSKLLVACCRMLVYEMDTLRPDVKYATRSRGSETVRMASRLRSLSQCVLHIYHYYADLVAHSGLDIARVDAEMNRLYKQSRL